MRPPGRSAPRRGGPLRDRRRWRARRTPRGAGRAAGTAGRGSAWAVFGATGQADGSTRAWAIRSHWTTPGRRAGVRQDARHDRPDRPRPRRPGALRRGRLRGHDHPRQPGQPQRPEPTAGDRAYAHLERAGADPDVRVVLVESLRQGLLLRRRPHGGVDRGHDGRHPPHRRAQRLIATLDKPVVTKNLGAVRAGGIGIVAAADIAVSADDATFALTEVARAGCGDHQPHRPPPDEPAGRGPHHARR
ncbi:enoyl-CoA hydratase-related protein [Nocardioides sp. T5]|uniref:enoyl-CoA hydratase-related protein n=1 Tax=Nocardioides sp. T5 TaxID=3400182 RepID=UPI003A854990